jgi:lipid II:glycine glycyltransferase (peptidoglycan interpeptide bridge formation enzyme)
MSDSSALHVQPIPPADHLAFVEARSASFLQCPSWGEVKADWRAESLGWFTDENVLVGAGLVIYRQVPRLKRYLAYLPEGPVIDWAAGELSDWLDPLVRHLRDRGAFSIKMGPQIVVRRWQAETIKAAIATAGSGSGAAATRLPDLPPDATDPAALRVAGQLRAFGWRQNPAAGAGFGDVQPRYVFQVPLDGRSLDDVLTGFNQLWRRNIKKAAKAKVEVVRGDYDDLPAFHNLYRVTAERDRFTPRALSYFQRMYRVMTAERPDRLRLYLARHEGEVLAATTMVTVGRHAWYSYGASANHKREVRPSNAIQWQMIQDAHASGADVYDLRGITDTLDPNDHLFGLIQFKLGTGGQAVEYLGEWDYPINKLMHKAFELYLSRR